MLNIKFDGLEIALRTARFEPELLEVLRNVLRRFSVSLRTG